MVIQHHDTNTLAMIGVIARDLNMLPQDCVRKVLTVVTTMRNIQEEKEKKRT